MKNAWATVVNEVRTYRISPHPNQSISCQDQQHNFAGGNPCSSRCRLSSKY
jgi:hypothetical protein